MPFRSLALATALCACALTASAASAPPDAADGFVKVSGSGFVLGGRPFRVAGVNNHYLTFGSEREVVAVLDAAVEMGASVVRTFLQPVIGDPTDRKTTIWNFDNTQEASNLGVSGRYLLYWNPATRRMAMNEGENGMRRVDFLIAEAAKRGLRLYIAFLDFWDYTGGAQQMRAWYGSHDKYTFFFQDPRTRADYRAWVGYVVNRRNQFTGVIYKDDPTIFAWDLMNEPAARPDSVRLSWIADMAGFVKSVDPNHLVSSGHANVGNNLDDAFVKGVDFASWHGYTKFYNQTPEQYRQQIVDFCAIAESAGKPAVLSEFGLARSDSQQAARYDEWLRTLDAQPGCGGWLVWRLVGRQDNGRYPVDQHDQFDVTRDSGATWKVLQAAAERARRLERPTQ